jgi:hypothetical protein
MKPEWLIAGMIFGFALLAAMMMGCAPQGYIEGETACQVELDRIRNENENLTDKYVRYKSEPEPEEEPSEDMY